MKAKFVQLCHVEREGSAPDHTYHGFTQILQTSLLLALKERGLLEETVCAAALEQVERL